MLDEIVTRHQVVEKVSAIRPCDDRPVDGAGQFDRHALDGCLARIKNAIVVRVKEDVAGNAGQGHRCQGRAVLIILVACRIGGCGIGIELSGVVDLRDVGLGARGGYIGGDLQAGRRPLGQCAHGPDAAGAVVAALAGVGRDQRDARRQNVLDLNFRGRIRASIGDGHGVNGVFGEVRRGIVHRFGHRQVGYLGGQSGVVLVILPGLIVVGRRIRVELIRGGDLCRVGHGADRLDGGCDLQRCSLVVDQVSHGPDAACVVVIALAGIGRNESQLGG